MSGRGMQASLSVQADRLKKTMQNRDQRRRKEQNQRAARSDTLDPYERSQNAARDPSATGGLRLGPAAAALAAVADASSLQGPTILRCEPCQATFATEAMLQQHNEGPTHRKTLARLQAQQEKKRRMGHHSGAAEAALAAAAWAGSTGGEPARVARQMQEEAGAPPAEPMLPDARQAPGAAHWRMGSAIPDSHLGC
ncbi:hypothetical protein WJX84_003166 [Apatococcus fuscideae]|uniref:C2H2-type domain-containing protein n=1 Tax=Apatococcus fuscideae TaxID=2026836 RepID=A0AAW1TAD9_9CHLO